MYREINSLYNDGPIWLYIYLYIYINMIYDVDDYDL